MGDYIHDSPARPNNMTEVASNRREMTAFPAPVFLTQFQKTVTDLDLNKMLGMSDREVTGLFYYDQPELDRTVQSSYKDYDRELVLPQAEMEHVLTCVYPDIPRAIAVPLDVLLSSTTPINDISDLIVKEVAPLRRILEHSSAFITVNFVARMKHQSSLSRRSAVKSYFNNRRSSISSYLAIWK